MARYSRIVKKKKQVSSIPFLPEIVQTFVARRVIDAAGLTLVLGGFALMAALASYNSADPSWNTSTGSSAHIHNWMGLPGAWIADVLVQTLGLGGGAFGLVAALWGTKILARQDLSPLPLRFAALIATALFISMSVAMIPAGTWLVNPWLGGSGGTLMLSGIAGVIQPFTGTASHIIIALTSGLLALAVGGYALAVTLDDWKNWTFTAAQLSLAAAALSLKSFNGFVEWVKHYGDPDYNPVPKISGTTKKPRKIPALLAPVIDAEEVEENEETDDKDAVPVVAAPKTEKTKKASAQTKLKLSNESGEWEFPAMELMQEPPAAQIFERPDEGALRKNAEILKNVLADFNVQGDIVSIHPGPVVTLYELEPAPGTKTSRVIALADDIARSMSAVSVRSAVIPGRNVIGIEMPNKRRQTVYMRELLETPQARQTDMKLPLVLGKDISGSPIIADLARMPHLLVAGTTGSGKSVAVNTMILSLVYRLPPEKCRFLMIDPKMLELSVYDNIPHLLSPVVTDPGKAIVSLKWAVQEMENRYRAMSKLGVRNIEGFNARLREAVKKGETLTRRVQTGFDLETGKPVYEEQPLDTTELPYIVIIVDEFADLMLVAGKDVENAIQRLAQMARAAGIHLIMATQRPSVDVITGVIKANFPTRISFQVTSKIDSRTILGEGGAEQLLGMGDMLYMAAGGRITRVHGPFVSDEDVENVVNHLKAQGEPEYLESITDEDAGFGDSPIMDALFGDSGGASEGSAVDELYDQAVAVVLRERKASTSFIQRYLQIGYNRAARIIEEMERQGLVGAASPTGKREVLMGKSHD
jgi:S-DNA-T family DNA segregation ATPase FtsK/SpoIIIE